ncbi:hypothetical protein WH8501_09120 [Crocosphaera watsonii WH 8501]|uniref:hypothetical protein n=1 Tax=Crocosphaera watsonii TaxID=263511 RepID=UPI000039D2D8|nr:hypothetical protein [Crocosphaera watsonii]
MGKSAIALFKPTSCKASVFGDRRFCEKFGSSISVYDFFRTCNWVGETSNIKDFDAVELIENSQSLLA